MSDRHHAGFLLGDVAKLDAALPRCMRQRRFLTFMRAHAFREELYRRYGCVQRFNCFWCDACQAWHLGRRPRVTG